MTLPKMAPLWHEEGMGQELARVLDPEALEACSKPRGRLAIEVPPEWAGAEIDVALPSRLSCARCDGGGCDGCERRGGHKLPGDADERTIRVRLPDELVEGIVIRLVNPLGGRGAEEAGIEQLLLEARLGDASACVTLRFLPAIRLSEREELVGETHDEEVAHSNSGIAARRTSRLLVVWAVLLVVLALVLVLVARR